VPIKSQAQRRKFAELLMKGEISEEVYERWNREAGSKVLPERVKPKTQSATSRKAGKRKAGKETTSRSRREKKKR